MKAVIPCAGFGTRFLPATKSIPKEMLSIVDKPIIMYAVEEAVSAGIEEIIIVLSPGKIALEHLFANNTELEKFLKLHGKTELLESITKLTEQVKITYTLQHEAKGLGHAILQAKNYCSDDFAVILPDEMLLPKNNHPAALDVLIKNYQETGLSSVAVINVSDENVHKYGIVEYEDLKDNRMTVTNILEKPLASETSSRMALPGRYVFTHHLFDILEQTQPGKNNEIQLSDAMAVLAKTQGLEANLINTHRFDVGDKLGFLKAQVHLGLKHPSFHKKFKAFIEEELKQY